MSSSGKPRPQSTTIMSLPYSSTVMFLPISFKPPSGMIFSFSANKITTPLMIKTQACRRTVMLCHSEKRSGVGISGKCFEFAGIYRKTKNDAARLPRPLAGPRNDKTGSFDPKSQHSCDEKTSPPASAGAESRKIGKHGLRPAQKCTGQAESGRTGQLSAMQTRRKTKRAAVPGKRRSIGRTCDETRARPGMPRREAGKLRGRPHAASRLCR